MNEIMCIKKRIVAIVCVVSQVFKHSGLTQKLYFCTGTLGYYNLIYCVSGLCSQLLPDQLFALNNSPDRTQIIPEFAA